MLIQKKKRKRKQFYEYQNITYMKILNKYTGEKLVFYHVQCLYEKYTNNIEKKSYVILYINLKGRTQYAKIIKTIVSLYYIIVKYIIVRR